LSKASIDEFQAQRAALDKLLSRMIAPTQKGPDLDLTSVEAIN